MTSKDTPPPLVLCVWEDAKSVDSEAWAENKDHTYEAHLFQQVGFLLSDTEQGVLLTQAWHKDLVAKRDQIPRAMIRSITYLQPAPVPKRKR